MRVLSERGRASLDLLLLDGRPIAGIYGFVYQGAYYFYLPGFAPDVLPKASPGLLVLYHRIQQAIRRSITLRYYNRSVRAVALKLLESGKQAAKILLR